MCVYIYIYIYIYVDIHTWTGPARWSAGLFTIPSWNLLCCDILFYANHIIYYMYAKTKRGAQGVCLVNRLATLGGGVVRRVWVNCAILYYTILYYTIPGPAARPATRLAARCRCWPSGARTLYMLSCLVFIIYLLLIIIISVIVITIIYYMIIDQISRSFPDDVSRQSLETCQHQCYASVIHVTPVLYYCYTMLIIWCYVVFDIMLTPSLDHRRKAWTVSPRSPSSGSTPGGCQRESPIRCVRL